MDTVADEPERERAQAVPERRAHAGPGGRGKPSTAFDFCYLSTDTTYTHQGHRPGDLRCRCATRGARVAAPGGRWCPDREHPQVPVEGPRHRRLRAGLAERVATDAVAARCSRPVCATGPSRASGSRRPSRRSTTRPVPAACRSRRRRRHDRADPDRAPRGSGDDRRVDCGPPFFIGATDAVEPSISSSHRARRSPMSASLPDPMTAESRLSGKQIVSILFTCLILAGAFAVLKPFLLAIIWAAIIAIASWPLYLRIEEALRRPARPSAVLTTALICLLLVGPMVLLDRLHHAGHRLRRELPREGRLERGAGARLARARAVVRRLPARALEPLPGRAEPAVDHHPQHGVDEGRHSAQRPRSSS